MLRLFFFLALFSAAQAAPSWEIIAQFPDRQPTGIAVSKEGRIFLNFPHWDEFHNLSVAELLPNGALRPYPLEWDQDGLGSSAAGAPSNNSFYCVQSVFCDDENTLWILDSGSPGMAGVVAGQAKLIEVDLATNKAKKTIVFNAQAAPLKSYLNDVRIDTARHIAYLTDSGLGALLVVDIDKGSARRVLENHPSTQPEPDFALRVMGKPVQGADGKPLQVGADGIELSADRQTLYYHALSGRTLYSVPAAALLDPALSADQLAAQVQVASDTGPVDGLARGPHGEIYLSCLEDGTIRTVTPPSPTVAVLLHDDRFLWPDSFAVAQDGTLYLTCSQIENGALFNGGESARTTPYSVFKIVP